MGGGGVVLKRGGAVIGRDNYFAFFPIEASYIFFGGRRSSEKNGSMTKTT